MVFPADVGIYLSSDRGRGDQELYYVPGRDKKVKEGRSKTVTSPFTPGRSYPRQSKGGGWNIDDQLAYILVP